MSQTDQNPAHAGLTDEEIEALAELEAQLADTDSTDPLFNPGEVVTAQPGDEEEEEEPALTPEEEQAKADAAQVVADEKAAAEAAESAGAAKLKEEQPPRDPILVAQAPEDAEAKLADIATKKGELSEKFDDGDLTSKEYQAQLDALSKEERALERAIDKAEIAQDLEDQRVTNERMGEINTFLKEVDIPHDPKNMRFSVLNGAVITVANEDTDGKLSVREVMEKAYELCVKEGVLPAKKAAAAQAKKDEPAAKTPRKPIQAPPTLNSLPASEITSTEDNRFAYLNRIGDPDKREAAFAKLSAADQEAYLATGG